MAVLTTLDFDGYTQDQALIPASVSSPWVILEQAFVATSAAAAHGARGAHAAGVSTVAQMFWDESSTTATRVASQYFRLVNHPGASFFGRLTSSGTNRADWRVNADGTVAIRNSFTAVASSTATLSTGVWYRSEWMTSTSGQELRIYVGESTTPHLTLTGALTDNTHDRIAFGVTAQGGGRDFDMDTLRVGDDWVGPFAPAAPESIWHLVTGPGTSVPLGDPVVVP